MQFSKPHDQRSTVVRIAVVVSLAVLAPLISYALSFFALGQFAPFARLLQVNSSPLFPLLPGVMVGLLAIGFGWWQFRRQPGSVRGSIILWGGSGALLSSLFVLVFALLLALPRFSVAQRPFDAEGWRAADCSQSRVRQQMFAGMREVVLGKTQAEVEAILGQPTDGQRSYCLGPEAHVIPVDREFMQVLYDRNGRAAELKVSGN
ncbi:MAG: hypothetical protein ACOYBJ_00055 [Patescibacteria group bacterium]|jgi:hypothetical protein